MFTFKMCFFLKVILNALFFKYDLKTAVEASRVHNQLNPNTTVAEPDFDQVGLMHWLPHTLHQKVRTRCQCWAVHIEMLGRCVG